MIIKGTVRNGVIVPEGDKKIPEGTPVDIIVMEAKPLGEDIMRFAGTLRGPKDLARNHDHYLYGNQKK
jgi:hypothetical protein